MTCRKIIFCILFFTYLEFISGGALQASESGEDVSFTLTKKNHKKVLSENKYVFVKFYTEWYKN